MDDGVFGFAHAIFHLVLIAILHGRHSPQVLKARPQQKQKSHNQPGVATKLQARPRDVLKQKRTIETKGLP